MKPVSVDETPIVAMDRALYGISEERYAIWKRNLRMDPTLGVSEDGVNYEYRLGSVTLRYMLYNGRSGVCVTVVGIRPVESVASGEKILDRLSRIVKVVERIKEVLSLLKEGL